ncbi:hypothetical protein NDU88_005151 [Pleurodeles waltl]|uniref:C2H2-type domain-containing protein n=1 Tax=Pleurodeles waltl TaxID=8319 RepID=A0AAV7M949_PLEWA|nr:hypothetical protein NDU88_005151 [Pleurodeles waltl]
MPDASKGAHFPKLIVQTNLQVQKLCWVSKHQNIALERPLPQMNRHLLLGKYTLRCSVYVKAMAQMPYLQSYLPAKASPRGPYEHSHEQASIQLSTVSEVLQVHKVIIGTEVTTAQEVGETVKKSELMVVKMDEKDATLEGETTSNIEDEFLQNQSGEDEVKLQMKCGRCHLSTLTFSEMKFHLLYDHGEEIDGHPKEGEVQTADGGQEELLKHAALHWKQWNERRSLVKCDHCEEFCSGHKLKKHMSLFHADSVTAPVESKDVLLGNDEPVQELQEVDTALQNQNLKLHCNSGLNCVLCTQMFARKEDLFSHWQNQHSCEEPSVLWTIFSSYFEQK